MSTLDGAETWPAAPVPRGRRSGFSYVELMVSIVLVGMVVIATLVGLRATITASAVNDERAEMVSWLQAGIDVVHRTPYVDCAGDPLTAYSTAIGAVPAPSGWTGGSLQVTGVRFSSVDPVRFVELWGTACDPDRPSQLVTIVVTAPGGLSESVQVVRDG